MKLSQLDQLRAKLAELERHVYQHDAQLSDNDKKWLNNKNRFHDQLFEQQGATLAGCLAVMKKDLQQIEQMITINVKGDALDLACQRFGNRFQAVMQAIANTSTVKRGLQQTARRRSRSRNDSQYQWIARSVMNSSHQLYAELRKHQNWDGQLQQRILELEQNLDDHQGKDKIAHQNLILTTHQRLGKCRQAISYIEQRIAWLEKKSYD
ncbi:primosomal replication protein [Ferrimonas lipolytica]|uniref:Prepilin peptidase n=1 Tax=Ferrimonas lipolytica TaxID=2724191 RepID=A0A6H1UEZ1_9GAMM|nr:primosomal replication protein [Ferrimonas lipolytica]QIZ77199.1 prepilin peptidase [Ferrimonas lipolytica]